MTTDIEATLARLEASGRRWRKATLASLGIALVALILPYVSLVRTREPGSFAPSASLTPSYMQFKVDQLQVRSLDVVDDKGVSVVSMNEGAGGGIVSVTSATPMDHSVMIMASPHGADVTVSSQHRPRQFGTLKIMDGKPYLQLYEEGSSDAKKFYQAPVYQDDGTIGSPANH